MLLIEDGVTLAFPTPILLKRSPFNAFELQKLEALCLRERESGQGTLTSNVGGWRSSEIFLEHEDDQVRRLSDWVHQEATHFVRDQSDNPALKVSVTGWINVNGPGHYKQVHAHGNFAWAGSFMVSRTLPRDAFEGAIQFIDPRMGAPMVTYAGSPFHSPRANFQQEPGTLMLFPAWLLHSINPTAFDARPRVSIGLDVAVEAGG